MGRERQKAKNRSSIAKVRHKAPSKKKVLNNPIIAANWNQKETLTQNYRRLGLTSRLNYPTGGTERLGSNVHAPNDDQVDEPVSSTTSALKIGSKLPTTLDVTETRVERDPVTGAITAILDAPGATKPTPARKPLDDLLHSSEDENNDAQDDGQTWAGLVNEHGLRPDAVQRRDGTTETVRALEEAAARPAARRVRKQSEREAEWVSRLVKRHGDDFRAMSRDAKLNIMQQSEGDIKRRVAKWRAAGGQL